MYFQTGLQTKGLWLMIQREENGRHLNISRVILMINAMIINAMLINAMKCNANKCNAMQCNAMQCNTM